MSTIQLIINCFDDEYIAGQWKQPRFDMLGSIPHSESLELDGHFFNRIKNNAF